MKDGVVVLVSVFLLGTMTIASAQNLNDSELLAVAQSGIAKLAESEWSKLPELELDCINQELRNRGDSVQSIAKRGMLPIDAWTRDIRSQCPNPSGLPSPASRQTAVMVQSTATFSETGLGDFKPVVDAEKPETAPVSGKTTQTEKVNDTHDQGQVTVEAKQTNHRMFAELDEVSAPFVTDKGAFAEIHQLIYGVISAVIVFLCILPFVAPKLISKGLGDDSSAPTEGPRPNKSSDQADLVNAAELGAQELVISLSDLVRAVSEPVLPERAAALNRKTTY
jgi:hypothetical protein